MNLSPGTLPGDCNAIQSYLFATSFPRMDQSPGRVLAGRVVDPIRPAFETTWSLSHQGLFFHMPQR
ncbi:MAG: hypothetical protein WCA60_00405 [Methanoregula sp.]